MRTNNTGGLFVTQCFSYSSVWWNQCRARQDISMSHTWSPPPSSMIPARTSSLAKCASYNCQSRFLRLRSIHSHVTEPIIHVEKADVYHYGSVQRSEAIFKNLSWTVNPGEAWAIVCNSNVTRGEIFQVR